MARTHLRHLATCGRRAQPQQIRLLVHCRMEDNRGGTMLNCEACEPRDSPGSTVTGNCGYMKVIAIVAAVVTLLVAAFVSYCLMQMFARGPLVEGAAIVIGFIAAIFVKNAITAGTRADG
jgi:hypothetical protein